MDTVNNFSNAFEVTFSPQDEAIIKKYVNLNLQDKPDEEILKYESHIISFFMQINDKLKTREQIQQYAKGLSIKNLKEQLKTICLQKYNQMQKSPVGERAYRIMTENIKKGWKIQLHPFPMLESKSKEIELTHGLTNNNEKIISLYGLSNTTDETFVHEINHITPKIFTISKEGFVGMLEDWKKNCDQNSILFVILNFFITLIAEKENPINVLQMQRELEQKLKISMETLQKSKQITLDLIPFKPPLSEDEKKYFAYEENLFIFNNEEEFLKHLHTIEDGINIIKTDKTEIYLPVNHRTIESIFNKLPKQTKALYEKYKIFSEVKKVLQPENYNFKDKEEENEEKLCRILESLHKISKQSTVSLEVKEYNNVIQKIEQYIRDIPNSIHIAT